MDNIIRKIKIKNEAGEYQEASIDYNYLANKPFGDILETVKYDASTVDTTVNAINTAMVKIGEAPISINLLAGSKITIEGEGTIITDNMILTEDLISSELGSYYFNLNLKPTDSMRLYWGDASLLNADIPANLLYYIYVIAESLNILPIIVSLDKSEGGTQTGYPAGIWVERDSVNAISLEYDVFSPLPLKALPPSLPTDGSSKPIEVISGNVHIHNIGTGNFDPTTFDMSQYAVNDIVFIVGDFVVGNEEGT